jgi:glycerophosphoryl diester phosphodiesterase
MASDAVAAGRTLSDFDAALEAGVDMIEFDVLPERGGDRLLVAHDYRDAATGSPRTLEEVLGHLTSPRFEGIEMNVDLKLPGYELRALNLLHAFDAIDRALISSQHLATLEVIRIAEPRAQLGWSVPRLKRDPLRSRAWRLPALVAIPIVRALLPSIAAARIRAGRCDALMVHWRLVTRRLVRRIRDCGGEVYVWTVDELPRLRTLKQLGVTGVITNDPRLFTALA